MKREYLGLNRVEGTDALARLFNAYFKELHTLCLTAEPMYETMREVRLALHAGTRQEKRDMKAQAIRYYGLSVLFNSLDTIHGQVLEAIDCLENFFAKYGGDLLRFAIENRLAIIEEYGGEDGDYEECGVDEEGKPKWRVIDKQDQESLSHYTLHSELLRFFGDGSTRGEYLGTSQAEDFYPYTSAVEQASEFSLRKMLTSFTGKEITFSRLQPNGEMAPMSVIDHIESEMNEDIRNASVVQGFNQAIGTLHGIAAIVHDDTLRLTDQSALFRSVLGLLIAVRDMNLTLDND